MLENMDTQPLENLLGYVLQEIYKSTVQVKLIHIQLLIIKTPRGDLEQQLQHLFKKDKLTNPQK